MTISSGASALFVGKGPVSAGTGMGAGTNGMVSTAGAVGGGDVGAVVIFADGLLQPANIGNAIRITANRIISLFI